MSFRAIRVGRRLQIAARLAELHFEPDVIPIRIDPGSAFGTTHPTTQLCLEAIERHIKPGTEMIDIGTGTGILSIAAAKLGADKVLAVDNELEAMQVARENVAANLVSNKVRVEHGSLDEILAGKYGISQAPIVVANILSNVIVDLFGRSLADAVTLRGMLILSGFLRAQTPDIRARLKSNGLAQLAQEQLEEWVCILAGRC